MKRALLTAAFAAAIAIAAAGCGGGGNSAYKNLTHEEYAQELNQICAGVESKQNAVGKPTSIAEAAAKGPQLIDIAKKGVDNIKKVTPPSDEKDTVSQMVDTLNQIEAKDNDLVDAAKANDTAKVQQIAGEVQALDQKAAGFADTLGARGCSKSFTS